MTQNFDFNKALIKLEANKGLPGEDGAITLLIKQFTEAALKTELELRPQIRNSMKYIVSKHKKAYD